jgi:hypothetical protein
MAVGLTTLRKNCNMLSALYAKKFLREGYKIFPICLRSSYTTLRHAVLGVLNADQRLELGCNKRKVRQINVHYLLSGSCNTETRHSFVLLNVHSLDSVIIVTYSLFV